MKSSSATIGRILVSAIVAVAVAVVALSLAPAQDNEEPKVLWKDAQVLEASASVGEGTGDILCVSAYASVQNSSPQAILDVTELTMGEEGSGKPLTVIAFDCGGDSDSVNYTVEGADDHATACDGDLAECDAGIQRMSIELAGPCADDSSIYYRLWFKGYGWTGWGHDGEAVGVSSDIWRTAESLQVKLMKRGSDAPGSTDRVLFQSATRKQLIKAASTGTEDKKLTFINTDQELSEEADDRLAKAIKAVEQTSVGGELSFVMVDLTTGEGLSYASKRSLYSASCLKGPFVAAVNKYFPDSSKSCMEDTIVYSDNDAYRYLVSTFGEETQKKFADYCGVDKWDEYASTGWENLFFFIPCDELAKLWVGTYEYFYVDTNERSEYCRDLYTHGTECFITDALKDKYTVHAKSGFISTERLNAQNDAGIVMADGKPYLLCIMSAAVEDFPQLQELVLALDEVHDEMA